MTFVDRLLRRATRSRRLVLGVALAAGLACAIAVDEDRPPFEPWLIGDAVAAEQVRVTLAAETKDAAATPPTGTVETPVKPRQGMDAEITINESGVKIRRGRETDEPHVVVGDTEFESFEEFVEKAPWLAALVFMVTALVFLMPLLIIALIIWYKMRSNRMRNETMLKLAERGVVPPAEAVAAMVPGSTASLASLPSTAPLYEQVKQIRKRGAWSDLRKGVLMLGAGLGLSFWAMLDDGSANSVGLVLLFVGIGFIVLWYFEERQLTPPRDRGPGPSGGA
jgi:hypothetical protein